VGLRCGGFFAALSKFCCIGLGLVVCGWGCGDGEGRRFERVFWMCISGSGSGLYVYPVQWGFVGCVDVECW
jgi:hypothetical protein